MASLKKQAMEKRNLGTQVGGPGSLGGGRRSSASSVGSSALWSCPLSNEGTAQLPIAVGLPRAGQVVTLFSWSLMVLLPHGRSPQPLSLDDFWYRVGLH